MNTEFSDSTISYMHKSGQKDVIERKNNELIVSQASVRVPYDKGSVSELTRSYAGSYMPNKEKREDEDEVNYMLSEDDHEPSDAPKALTINKFGRVRRNRGMRVGLNYPRNYKQTEPSVTDTSMTQTISQYKDEATRNAVTVFPF